MKALMCAILATTVFCLPSAARLEYVFVDINGLAGDFTNIQDGIDAVSDGGTVVVLPGYEVPYTGPMNRALDLGGKNITLWGIAGSENTFIDCEGVDRAILLSAANDSTTAIVGFTILNGVAPDAGGAIKCEGAPPVFTDCKFVGNSAPLGGAISFADGTTRMTACEFHGNTATDGGALHLQSAGANLRACSFHGNSAPGATVTAIDSEMTMATCTLAGNIGSAAVRVEDSSVVIEQCVLAFNGPGKAVEGGSPEIFHCCVYGNEGGDDLPGNAHDNDFSDPLICDLEFGNFSLCSNSGCLEALNQWGLQVGSQAQGCGVCSSATRNLTWGSVKAMYR